MSHLHQALTLPATIRTTIVQKDPAEPQIEVAVHFDSALMKYLVTSAEFSHPINPITSTRLRKTRFATLVAHQLREELRPDNVDMIAAHTPIKRFFTGSKGRTKSSSEHSPSLAHLQQAAAVFTLARAAGFFPVRAVERCFGISYHSAKRWVRAARALSIMD